MEEANLTLQVLVGSFMSVAIVVLGYCICKTRKPTMKSSPSMEELNGVVSEDPSA